MPHTFLSEKKHVSSENNLICLSIVTIVSTCCLRETAFAQEGRETAHRKESQGRQAELQRVGERAESSSTQAGFLRMEQLPFATKLQDALFLAPVRFTLMMSEPHGKVEDIEKDTLTGETLYRVRFNDGDVQHFSEEEVRANRHPPNAKLLTCDFVPMEQTVPGGTKTRFDVTAMSGAQVACVVFARAPSGLQLRNAVAKQSKSCKGSFLLISVEGDIIHDFLQFDAATAKWQVRSTLR